MVISFCHRNSRNAAFLNHPFRDNTDELVEIIHNDGNGEFLSFNTRLEQRIFHSFVIQRKVSVELLLRIDTMDLA